VKRLNESLIRPFVLDVVLSGHQRREWRDAVAVRIFDLRNKT